ncbi:MAG TPA: hypothetical protein VFH71_06760 [Rhodanobacteraceae bacterium]|nr:hypothetical protein [Rhodanobacteraceae bacterium]
MARRMHRRILLATLALLGAFSFQFAIAAPPPVRILFVGNSLTYVGNLPAVLDALATANGRRVQSDMIVKGGATLTQWLARGSVQKALNARH